MLHLVNSECLNEPLGSAAALLADPVRRHVLTTLLTQATVTSRDVLHQFPGMTYGVHQRLTQMVNHGWLEVFRVRSTLPTHSKGNLHYHLTPLAREHLRELHVWLGDYLAALSPTPEATRETDR